MIISVAAIIEWLLCQLDVKNAFLHDDLNEEVYVSPPCRLSSQRGGTKCVSKSLYDHNQSSRVWLKGNFLDIGLHQCSLNCSVFVKMQSQGTILLSVHVNNVVLKTNDLVGILQLQS